MTGPGLAAVRMGRRLTSPFARGADTLALRLSSTGAPATADVEAYDFTDHFALFGRPPAPRYVLELVRDLAPGTVVAVRYVQPGGSPATATVTVPAGSLAGVSVPLDIPVSPEVRITGLTMTPAPPDGSADGFWRLTALLGTMAKLLWVVGGERDQLRSHFIRTVAQRHLRTAAGPSLDLIGADLGVPRFPPLPYGFDDGTVALYHLDEAAGSAVAGDLTGRYPGRSGHPGALRGAVRPGAPGRYGPAFAFDSSDAAVEAAGDPAFDIAADADATVECFVRPDATSEDGHLLFRHPGPGGSGAGWLLSIGDFKRGLKRNPRLVVTDGANPPVTLFADVDLPVDAFTHVAGVLDRAAKTLRLYVDGRLRASAPLGALGAVSNTAPLRIGPGGSGFRGAIDEVRISSVARADFSPALGEADEHYRRRLRVFRRWTLPTAANLEVMLNELVGTIDGLPDQLVVADRNAPLARGTRLIRIRPVTFKPGESLDAAGSRRTSEVDIVGTAADEERFDPAFLLRYDRTDVDFGEPGAPADPQLIQVGLAAPLDRLVALAAAEPGGRLRISAAYDPDAADLRASGRAVLLGHSTIAPGRLAALAHRAGFDFVRFHPDAQPDGAQVYAAMALGDYFAIDVAPAPAGPVELDTGSSVTLSLRPAPPPGSAVRWLIVPSGRGRGSITTSKLPVTELLATAAGQLVLRAEVTLARNTVAASRPLRIGLPGLPDAQSIAADGALGAPTSVVSDPHELFQQRFLLRHDDSRVNYGTSENNRLMQPAVARLLDELLTELSRRAPAGGLVVHSAFQPGGDEFAARGRQLVVSHPVINAAVLGSLAHAFGFGHVTRTGSTVIIRQAPGELVVVRGQDDSPVIELDEGTALEVSVQPALPDGPDRLGWATSAFGDARTVLGNPRLPTTTVRAESAGLAWVQASYQLGDQPGLVAPYTFRVGLRSGPDTVLAKDQYDLILNILHALHPVGVEVDTEAIRDHTVEVRDDPAASNPDFTFPKFRVRNTLPPKRRETSHG
ncbi:LamG domain-containing protein [Amycolatopsis nigrescens]|uniref:LamG domain-containing protein n=1 Tax=Amycolatopsis nigrescens TaxID=381445 RepID=UPI0003A51BB1|nr:LamG domain-containing protein [Amycolatopsis nigrescens]